MPQLVNHIAIKIGYAIDIIQWSCYNSCMTFTTHQSRIRTIKQSDSRFNIVDKFVTAPRAGFEISQRCPDSYKSLILECINNGWIKPVAHVHERELLFMGLSQE